MYNPYRNKFSRYAMYTNIQKFFKTNNTPVGRCLLVGDSLRGKSANTSTINNSTIVDMLPNGCKVIAPPYPDVDIQSMPYEDNCFSYVIADQVLEHVKKPWIAVEEVRRVLKPGGFAILTSCLMQPIHSLPGDYFRFTPDGLKVLCESFSKVYQCDGMGDLELVIRCLKGKRGEQVIAGTPLEKKAMAYDGKNMLHVWIIAQK